MSMMKPLESLFQILLYVIPAKAGIQTASDLWTPIGVFPAPAFVGVNSDWGGCDRPVDNSEYTLLMNTKIIIALAFCFLLLSTQPLSAQQTVDSASNQAYNSIYVELLGIGYFGSLNYERMSDYVNVRIGLTAGIVASITHSWRVAQNDYLEVGGGGCLFVGIGGAGIFASPILGYTYHPFDGGFLLKIQTQYLFFNSGQGSFESRGFWIGVSLGHSW